MPKRYGLSVCGPFFEIVVESRREATEVSKVVQKKWEGGEDIEKCLKDDTGNCPGTIHKGKTSILSAFFAYLKTVLILFTRFSSPSYIYIYKSFILLCFKRLLIEKTKKEYYKSIINNIN